MTTAATVVTDIEAAQAAVSTAQTDAAAAGVTGAVVPLASAASYLTTALAAAQAVVNPPPPPTGALATLASGCVRPIGPFSSDLTGFHRSDYSCIVYDPTGKRMLFFGGGHGLGQYTDIIAFDLTNLSWSSLYPSTPLSDMVAANADYTRGCWTTTGQPIARHSYINNVVASNRLYLMTGSSYDLVLAQAPVAWYDLTAGTWAYSAAGNPAWLYVSGACPDPQSTNVVVLGTDQQASGWYQLWLYDTATDKIANPCRFNLAGHMNSIRYLPSRDVFVSMQTNGVVWELALNRANPAASTLTPVTTTGTAPAWIAPQPMGFGANGSVLLGGVYKGVVFSYDMEARAWSQTQAKNEDGSNATANQAFYCADCDPVSGCLIFLGLDGQTYAYRP